ncbi:MAG: STAS domain-containing protein [Chitinivibrionales bacterium]|nr:STAS domain-containing protein [Chitinivibrionales bacterium]
MSNNNDAFSTLQVHVTVENNVAILSLCEPIFLGKQAKELTGVLQNLLKQSIKAFVFNLGDCDYISSDGLGVVASWWRFCHDQGNGAMAVVLPGKPDSEVANLFEIIGLTRMIGSAVQPSVKDALNYLKEFA